MGGCCGKPVESRKEGWGGASAGVSGRAGGGGGGAGAPPILAFVGLNGAGKSALLHTLQQHDAVVKPPRLDADTSGAAPSSPASGRTTAGTLGDGDGDGGVRGRGDDGAAAAEEDDVEDSRFAFTLEVQEGVLCAPPPTTEVTVSRIRAAGVAFTAVDVPGDRSARGRWTAAVEGQHGHGGGSGGGSAAATAVVFVVDAADELRMPVAREELWAGCSPAPPSPSPYLHPSPVFLPALSVTTRT